jgi:osmotically-inducible protein OsmY
MNKFTVQAIALSIGLAFSAGAAVAMTKDEYKSAKSSIASQYKADQAACKPMTGNAKDICKAEAKGKEKVAKAELEQSYKPSAKHSRDVTKAKAEAEYAVAKERCDDKAGADKKACIKDAKATRKQSVADAEKQPAARQQRTAVAKSKRQKSEQTAAATSKHQKPGEYVEDSVITGKVKAAVLEEPTLKSAEINVETYKGKVQLSGFVRSRTDINKAVQVARKVEGVKSVDNSMIVKGKQ